MKRVVVISIIAICLTFFGLARGQNTLPEGPGKKSVLSYCVQCHELSTVTRGGYSAEGWRNNLHMMVNVGAAVPRRRSSRWCIIWRRTFRSASGRTL